MNKKFSLKEEYEYFKIARGYEKYMGEKVYTFFDPVVFVYEILYMSAMRLTCKIKGHQYIDDSHAGPESGTMSYYCKRCGDGHSEILY